MSTKRSLVLSAALTLFVSTPVYALDFLSLVDTFLGGTSTTALNSQLDHQAELKTTIADREAQLGNEIDAGVKAGLLTNVEQTELRNDLTHFEFLEGTAFADRNLNANEARTLIDSLSNISRKLNVYMTNSDKTGFAADLPTSVNGNRYGWWAKRHGGNQVAIQAMIDAEQAEIDSSINRALYERRISASQAQSLRVKLNAVATAETAAQADGRITTTERDQLLAQLQTVEDAVKQAIAQGPERRHYGRRHHRQDPTAYASYLRTRIQTALTQGKITRAEANRLFAKERQISQLQASLRKDYMGNHPTEEKLVMAKLDKLALEIDTSLGNRWW